MRVGEVGLEEGLSSGVPDGIETDIAGAGMMTVMVVVERKE